jgi:hypothetical protein
MPYDLKGRQLLPSGDVTVDRLAPYHPRQLSRPFPGRLEQYAHLFAQAGWWDRSFANFALMGYEVRSSPI